MPSKVHIDHVMPKSALSQGLWPHWDEKQFKRWNNQWANLIPLTGKSNQTKAAKKFQEAKGKNILDNGRKCKYETAKEVFRKRSWTPRDVENRAKKLSQWATEERWPLP